MISENGLMEIVHLLMHNRWCKKIPGTKLKKGNYIS
jgi:hypothetical protein